MRRLAYTLFFILALPVGAQRFDTLVKNAGAPRYAGTGRLVPEVTIGGADATADEYLFASELRVLAAKDGSVWVIDGARPVGRSHIRRYDQAGKFIRNVGRKGDGPGEWQSPSMLAQLKDGRVVLRDAVVARPLILYKQNGDYDTTWSYPTRTIHTVAVDTAANLWLQYQDGVTFRSISPLLTVRIRPDASVIDTISPTPNLPPLPRPTFRMSRERGGFMDIGPPYYPMRSSAWSPHGYTARAAHDRYAINLMLPRTLPNGTTRPWRPGDRVLSIRRDVDRVPVSDAERRDQVAYMHAKAEAYGGTRTGTIPEVPRQKPFIRSVQFDLDGRLWVRVHTHSEQFEPPPQEVRAGATPQPVLKWREANVFDLFESNGSYLGRLNVPHNTDLQYRLIQSRGDIVWGVAKDDDGVVSIVRYRIDWR
jgi:hypothetical protein